MISMMHRLVKFCGKYKVPIRISYLPGFFKGLVMKSPLMASFFLACDFMAGRMTKKSCLIYGLIILSCVILQAVLQNITDRLQSATGFKVFADKRMEMGDHFRRLSMGYFTDGNIGKVSSVLATDMNFIELHDGSGRACWPYDISGAYGGFYVLSELAAWACFSCQSPTRSSFWKHHYKNFNFTFYA